MGDESAGSEATLPPGETDPNVLYIAVGMAIHRWEHMEHTLSRLRLKFIGLPDLPHNHVAFGQKNGIFEQRMRALEKAAKCFFQKHHDQHQEGEFLEIVKSARVLSIERHRIAHGSVTMWGEWKIPNLALGQRATVSATFLYRWAPPFYSVAKLRTNPVGLNGAGIDAVSLKFEALDNRTNALIDALPHLPSPETPPQ